MRDTPPTAEGRRGPTTAPALHRRRSRTWTALLLAWGGLWAVGAAGVQAQPEDNGERIEVSAEDSIEVRRSDGAVEARGGVRVRRGESVLGADSVEVERPRKLRARGSVFLQDPRYRLRASELELDLTDETGTILDPQVFIEEGGLTLSGSRAEKFLGQTYAVEDGSFTTCQCEEGAPPWRIGARDLRLGEDGRAVADDVTFYLYDVPVMYLPYASFPALAERATGLLLPSLGWSDQAGLLYQQPFFWAVDESNDVTLSVGVESEARLGVTGQVRTVLDARTDGQLDLSYFNERPRGSRPAEDARLADPSVPVDRWSVLLTHRHSTPSGWATFSDAALYSDSFATRELLDFSDLDAGQRRLARTSRSSLSRLGFHWHGAGLTLEGELDHLQDFVQPQEQALHRVPHLAFSGLRGLGRRLELGWDVQATRYVRQELADGWRVDIRPELTWPVTVGRHFRLATSVALRETLYRLDAVDGRFDPVRNDFSGSFPRNSSRELLEVRSTLATSLSRTHDWRAGPWRRVRHVLEPAVEYLFIPSTDQRDLPVWDHLDRIQRRNLLTLSLTNRFWGKREPDGLPVSDGANASGRDGSTAPEVVERFASARVAASFDLDQGRGGGDSLSDVELGLGLNPADNLDLFLDLGIDPGPWDLREAALGFSLSGGDSPETGVPDRDFRRPNGLSLGYRHLRASPLTPLADHANLHLLADCPGDPRCRPGESLEGVEAEGLLRVTDRLLLLYDGSYDGASGRLTRNQMGVKYLSRCKCWTLSAFVDMQTNPDRTVLGVRFNLLGLGS